MPHVVVHVPSFVTDVEFVMQVPLQFTVLVAHPHIASAVWLAAAGVPATDFTASLFVDTQLVVRCRDSA
jgi:hypothetical protein